MYFPSIVLKFNNIIFFNNIAAIYNIFEFIFIVKILTIFDSILYPLTKFFFYNIFTFFNECAYIFINNLFKIEQLFTKNLSLDRLHLSYNLDLNLNLNYNLDAQNQLLSDKNYFFNINFHTQPNYNSFFIYVYIFFYFITNIPFLILNLFLNLFNLGVVTSYFFEINNLIVN